MDFAATHRGEARSRERSRAALFGVGLPVLALLAAVPAAGEEQLRLDEVLASVTERAPDVRVEAAALRASIAEVGVAGAWPDPTVSVMAEEVPIPGTMSDELEPMIAYRVSQPLSPIFGRRTLAKRAASARVDASRATLSRAVLDARAQAFGLFHELWMNDGMRVVLDAQIATLRRMRESAKARYASGLEMGHHEILRAEAEVATMQAEAASLDDERLAIAAMLNVLRGRPPGDATGSPVLGELPPLPALEDVLAAGARRPELERARAMLAEMSARRALARTEYLPMVMIGAGYEQMLRMTDAVEVEVSLSVPIWFFDRQRSEVAMAEAMLAQAEREVEAMTSMTDAELRMAWSRARAADRVLRVLDESALPKLRETVRSAEAAYVSGTADFLSLLDATLGLRALEADRLRAVVRREQARYELTRLAGDGPAGRTR